MNKFMRVALVATVATGSMLVGALPVQAQAVQTAPAVQTAQAADRDNCRGTVLGMRTSGSAVVVTYNVRCNRVQNRIIVSAEVTRHQAPVKVARKTKTCNNTSTCTVHPRISNLRGRQLYSGSAFAAIARRGNYIAGCGYVEGILDGGLALDGIMTCRASDKFF